MASRSARAAPSRRAARSTFAAPSSAARGATPRATVAGLAEEAQALFKERAGGRVVALSQRDAPQPYEGRRNLAIVAQRAPERHALLQERPGRAQVLLLTRQRARAVKDRGKGTRGRL